MDPITWIIIYVVILIVAIAAAILLTPSPPSTATNSPAADPRAPMANPGDPIPVVFGTYVLKQPNVVDYGDLRSDPIYSDQASGGKK